MYAIRSYYVASTARRGVFLSAKDETKKVKTDYITKYTLGLYYDYTKALRISLLVTKRGHGAVAREYLE